MTDDESEIPDYAAIAEQIQQHPGNHAGRSWDSLEHVHSVLTTNERELVALVSAIEQNKNNLATTVVGNMGPQQPRTALFRELLRRLHNYVASAGTLIDHTRNLIETYQGTPTHEQYLERLAAAKRENVLPFVSKLRNYVLHVGIPAIGVQLSMEDGIESCMVYIDRDAALEWRDWPTAARDFLQSQPEKFPLKGVIEAYGEVIKALYDWLYGQYEFLHGDEIADLNELIRRTRPPWMDRIDPPPDRF